MSSIALAHRGLWFPAAAIIGAAAVLDSLDGPAARLLHSTSRVGAELDSLSDCVSFGIAPAVVMYLWGLDRHPIGWLVCLVYAVCTTLRLARFNSLLDDANPKPWSKGFFTGIPSPAGALLVILPMALSTRFGEGWWTNKWGTAMWMLLIAVLMISRIPSIALKSVYFPSQLILPALVGLVIAVALAFYQPIIMFTIGLGVYVAHLPYAAWRYRHVRQHPELWYDNRLRNRIRARRRRLRPRVPLRRVAGQAGAGRRLPLDRYLQRSRGGATAVPPVNGNRVTRRLGRRRRLR